MKKYPERGKMRRLIESGIVKEAGIFAGAWMGVQLFGAFQQPPTHHWHAPGRMHASG